mgnify:CR=1 FL=1
MKTKKNKSSFFVSEKIVDKFKLNTTNDSVNFYIPYRRMIDKNTLLLKNGGFARVFEIINKDLDYVDDICKKNNISYYCISPFNISLFKC